MPRPSAARWKWPSMPPLWPTKATPGFDVAAQRLAREQHVQHHAVDVVGDAEAVRSDDGESAVARGGGDLVLRRLVADLGKARGEHHRRADLAARAGLDRVAHARGRQREHGEVDALGQFVRALEHRPAVDRLAAAADQMDVALEVVELERLQDDLAGAARARRHADDRHRSRAQESGDGLRAACGLPHRSCRVLVRLEHQQMLAVVERMPVRLHLHADLQVLGLAVDHVGDDVDADVERHARDGVGLGAAGTAGVPRWAMV